MSGYNLVLCPDAYSGWANEPREDSIIIIIIISLLIGLLLIGPWGLVVTLDHKLLFNTYESHEVHSQNGMHLLE